jgi:peptide/nickel transport system ATP-binding protein
MIAMAVSCEPKLIIADEPTTALDVTVQGKILAILQKLCSKLNTALIFITHDLGVVSKVSDKLLVMRKGKVVESGSTNDVLHHPKEEYTRALIDCRPRLDFSPYRLPIVGQEKIETSPRAKPEREKEILKVENLNLSFAMKKNWLGKPTAYFKALQDINFHVLQGETLGLVGESGCGKTTLGRSLIKLVPIDSGSIQYQGTELSGMTEKEFKSFRKKIQIVFQDPYGSLNPRFTVGESISEPMIYHKITSGRKEARSRAMDLLDKVGLEKAAFSKYPHEFSGGQRQRVCIARALSVYPEFLICDESVSALDVSVQAKVLNLLNDLKEELNLTYIFISHDLSVVKYMSDRVMVMRKGRVVEIQDADDLYKKPESDYTRDLIKAIPEI